MKYNGINIFSRETTFNFVDNLESIWLPLQPCGFELNEFYSKCITNIKVIRLGAHVLIVLLYFGILFNVTMKWLLLNAAVKGVLQ